MAKSAKTPDTPRFAGFKNIRSKIKTVFNLIRWVRVVLRHVEACLSELFALDSEELENQLPGVVHLADPSTVHSDPEID
jgi:hypothetical protein